MHTFMLDRLQRRIRKENNFEKETVFMDVILLSSERFSPPQGQLQGFAEEGGGGETDGNPGYV